MATIVEGIPGYVSLKKAAGIIGVSHAQAWRYVTDGLLDALKIGSTYHVRERDARRFKRPPRGNPAFREQSKKNGKKNPTAIAK